MRVLIVKTSSMGDIVHALPVVTDIARAHPRARIDWVVEEGFAEIPRLHPQVTRVIPVAMRRWRRTPLGPQAWRELLAVRRELQRVRYHAVIDCQGLLKSALLAWSARGPATGFDRRSAREPLAAFFYDQRVAVDGNWHAVDRNRTVAAQGLDYSVEGREAFGIAGRLDRLAVPAPFDEQGAVLLLPNASRAGKLWPEASWVALEHQLARAGHLSWMAWGSEAEHARCQAMARRMHAARVLPRAGLTQLAALAARATAVIGVDTGLTHLAAACGAPTVGIYRDFDPGLVGLRGPGPVRSLGGVDANPGVDEVLAAVLAARADAAR